jgi:hypothetical protein
LEEYEELLEELRIHGVDYGVIEGGGMMNAQKFYKFRN